MNWKKLKQRFCKHEWVEINIFVVNRGLNYNKGKKNGIWRIWDDNGILRYEMRYKEGRKTGFWYMWNERGKLISEKKY